MKINFSEYTQEEIECLKAMYRIDEEDILSVVKSIYEEQMRVAIYAGGVLLSRE